MRNDQYPQFLNGIAGWGEQCIHRLPDELLKAFLHKLMTGQVRACEVAEADEPVGDQA